MSDELKAAAERAEQLYLDLVNVKEELGLLPELNPRNYDDEDVLELNEGVNRVYQLAEKAIDEDKRRRGNQPPSDASDFVTGVWLMSVGFRCTNSVIFVHDGINGIFTISHAGLNWYVGDYRINHKPLRTRGDIRRLFAALGWELTETKG